VVAGRAKDIDSARCIRIVRDSRTPHQQLALQVALPFVSQATSRVAASLEILARCAVAVPLTKPSARCCPARSRPHPGSQAAPHVTSPCR